MDKEVEPLVFALCGLDGVGKTSVFSKLSRVLNGVDYTFVGRGPSDAETEVEKLFPRDSNNYKDWLEGDFASAMAFACALDYSAYHRATISGIINGTCSKLFGLQTKAVISDRHALCFQAYAHCISPPSQLSLKLLKKIPQPDVIFFIELPTEEVSRRSKKKDQFDDPTIQTAEKIGYETAFQDYGGALIRVDNSGSLEDTVNIIRREIEERIYSGKDT